MVDDTPDDSGSSPDSGRAKRAPPTIDLEPSEVSGDTQNSAADSRPRRSLQWLRSAAVFSAAMAAASGACAAAMVIAVAWILGWPGEVTPPGAPPQTSAAIDALNSRLAEVEAKAARPMAPAPDPAAAARVEALEKLIKSLRGEVSDQRAQTEKLAGAVNEVKSAPRESAASPDLSGINERIAQIERGMHAQSAAIAQEGARPANDVPLRRLVAASLLEVYVRHGDPYAAALAAAKSLAENPDALKPLETFAAAGVPSAAALSRELLMLVPKLSPPAQETSTAGTGIIDRLQAGAAKLVRIERTDAVGNDRNAVVARMTAAALRNDTPEARRELKTLAPENRAAAQSWIDKADARDTALAASRQFAAEAMAALGKPAR
jgi:hypothetical protein